MNEKRSNYNKLQISKKKILIDTAIERYGQSVQQLLSSIHRQSSARKGQHMIEEPPWTYNHEDFLDFNHKGHI